LKPSIQSGRGSVSTGESAGHGLKPCGPHNLFFVIVNDYDHKKDLTIDQCLP